MAGERRPPDEAAVQLQIEGVRLTRTALEFELEFAPDAYEQLLCQLGEIASGHQWWIGDALVEGEKVYGDDVYQYAEASGQAAHTLTNWRWVASAVTPERRREDLSFSHHAEVARLGPDTQAELLERAAREGWTVRQLRDHVAVVYPQSTPGPELDPVDPPASDEVATQRRLEEIERRLEAGEEIERTEIAWLLELVKRVTRRGRAE